MLSVSNDESGIAIKRYGMKNEKKKKRTGHMQGKRRKRRNLTFDSLKINSINKTRKKKQKAMLVINLCRTRN